MCCLLACVLDNRMRCNGSYQCHHQGGGTSATAAVGEVKKNASLEEASGVREMESLGSCPAAEPSSLSVPAAEGRNHRLSTGQVSPHLSSGAQGLAMVALGR